MRRSLRTERALSSLINDHNASASDASAAARNSSMTRSTGSKRKSSGRPSSFNSSIDLLGVGSREGVGLFTGGKGLGLSGPVRAAIPTATPTATADPAIATAKRNLRRPRLARARVSWKESRPPGIWSPAASKHSRILDSMFITSVPSRAAPRAVPSASSIRDGGLTSPCQLDDRAGRRSAARSCPRRSAAPQRHGA